MIRYTLIFALLTTLYTFPLRSQVSSCGNDLRQLPDAFLENLPDYSERSFSRRPKGGNPDTIAITIHIIEDGTDDPLMYEAIEKEIAAVNEIFGQAKLFFIPCGPIRIIKGEVAYNFTTGDQLNEANHVPNTINVYFAERVQSNNGGSICGYSAFPWAKRSINRYIMVARPCLDNGITLAHEFGHFYGLYHTHETYFGEEYVDGSNCVSAGDMICDTSADPNLIFAYITEECAYRGGNTDSQGKGYNPPVSNIMSYAPPRCKWEFSALQVALIRSIHEKENAYLYQNCDFYPDFTISFNIKSDVTVRSGDPILASYTFINKGGNQDYTLDLHFSIMEGNVVQGEPIKEETLTIGPNQGVINRKLNVNFPGNRGSGQYYLIAKVDAYNKIVERQEENNTAILSIEVDNSTLNNNALLFPNPVGEELNLFLRDKDVTGSMNIRIFRYDGQLVRTFTPINKKDEEVLHQLQVADLPAGVYLLSVDFESGAPYTFSFLKE